MSEVKMMPLCQVARKLNVGISTIVDSMAKKGFDVESNPNSKISMEHYNMLAKEFKSSAQDKEEASHLSIGKRHNETFTIKAEPEPEQPKKQEPARQAPPVEEKKETEPEIEKIASEAPKLEGIKVLGKIDLEAKGRPVAKPEQAAPKAEVPQEEPAKTAEKPVEQEAPKAETVETTTEKPIEASKKDTPSEEVPQAVKSQEQTIAKPEPQKGQPSDMPKEIKKETTAEKPTAPAAPKEETTAPIAEAEAEGSGEVIAAKADALKGLTVLGKIELPKDRPKKRSKPIASSDEKGKDKKKRPRKRIDSRTKPAGENTRPQTGTEGPARTGGTGRPGQGSSRPGQGAGRGSGSRPAQGARFQKAEPTQKEIQDQIKQTLARLQGGGKTGGGRGRNRRDKRADRDREL